MAGRGFNCSALVQQQRHYPTHDPLLLHYSSLINTGIQISTNSISIEGEFPHSPPSFESTVGMSEILPQSTTTGDEQEMFSPTVQISVEITTPDNNPQSDSSIPTGGDGQNPTRSHPKRVAYLLGLYLLFLGLVLKLSHTHFTTLSPFIIISVVMYTMAFLDLCILTWIYERLDNPNSSHQDLYVGYYTILKDAYYILCSVAFISLVPALVINTH